MSENEDLKAMKCTSCGGDVVKSYRTVDEDEDAPIARCVSCGTEYDQYSQEFYGYLQDDFIGDKDSSILKLGLKGVLDGVEYEIIGRIRFQEEDEYEPSTWDEWLAVSSDGVYHFFVEEEGEIHSYEEYVPKSIDMESSDSHIEFEGKKVDKDEGYIGRIVYFEGELTWKPEIGEPVTLYDFKKDGAKFTIEQSENEISITKGDRLSYKDIIEAFGKAEDKVLYDNTMRKRGEYKKKALVYLLGFTLTLAFTIYSCNTREVVPGVMNGKKIITNNKLMADKRSVNYFSQVLYGPFEIKKGNSLYDIRMFIDQSVHRLHLSWQSIRLMLMKEERLAKIVNNSFEPAALKKLFSEIDAQKEPVESYTVIGNFWDERGRDSDGSWHESDVSETATFVIDGAGKYYAYVELYNNKKRNVDSVKFSVVKTSSVRYYVILMVLLFFLMIINRMKGSSYNELPFDVADD